jgi:hypothetical protein
MITMKNDNVDGNGHDDDSDDDDDNDDDDHDDDGVNVDDAGIDLIAASLKDGSVLFIASNYHFTY